MGEIPRKYPSYSDLLGTQMGGESINSMMNPNGTNNEVQDEPSDQVQVRADDTTYHITEELID